MPSEAAMTFAPHSTALHSCGSAVAPQSPAAAADNSTYPPAAASPVSAAAPAASPNLPGQPSPRSSPQTQDASSPYGHLAAPAILRPVHVGSSNHNSSWIGPSTVQLGSRNQTNSSRGQSNLTSVQLGARNLIQDNNSCRVLDAQANIGMLAPLNMPPTNLVQLKIPSSHRDSIVQDNIRVDNVKQILDPPMKKIRLGELKDFQQPLRIDTRDPVQSIPVSPPIPLCEALQGKASSRERGPVYSVPVYDLTTSPNPISETMQDKVISFRERDPVYSVPVYDPTTSPNPLSETLQDKANSFKERDPVHSVAVHDLPTLPNLLPETLQNKANYNDVDSSLSQLIIENEREMNRVRLQLQALKTRESVVGECSGNPTTKVKDIIQPKHQSVAQRIYAENRRRAQETPELEKMESETPPPIIFPFKSLLDAKNHNDSLKKLQEHIRRKRIRERESRDNDETYSRLRVWKTQKWKEKDEFSNELLVTGNLEEHHIAMRIYSENRKKAQESHVLLMEMGASPLSRADSRVNQTTDTAFSARLVENLLEKRRKREAQERCDLERYNFHKKNWVRQVNSIENSHKWKTKQAQYDKVILKEFPELRKVREDQKRQNRIEARKLNTKEITQSEAQSRVAILPQLSERKVLYTDNNGRVEDFPSVFEETDLINVWSETEKEIFKQKYIQFPKMFHTISSFLPRKSAQDCVEYYYASKHEYEYKRLIPKSRGRTKLSRRALAEAANDDKPRGRPRLCPH
ncbi:myb-like protein P [Nilaparvata lugens]|uniref:myb-like protein P n=1 Tax=Nilaparvata lugens TaxID=108931 RepID=UPI00193CA962|nr:myb-like protein P [Nilaparvata lugens]XP_039279276.1 myb-like protein P [Nilaparvata lugens]XP_039279277.1 myb-like protein P [Nilaparvata lugens]XP_039279278.1 myb-like protein P [Nilaparvata lugens]XP_039279279.1 myb-like protein P [Nilaparvata lugens]XP_039279281.1 myb-like protein P [Nilaparvata lugens]